MQSLFKCVALSLLVWFAAGVVHADPDDERALTLYQAVAIGDRERVEGLIAEGVNVNRAQRPWELTPLLVAVGVDAELTDVLIRAGADVNAREREGVTVLMKAVHGGNAAVVRRLLEESGLDVDARGPRGNTALTYAVLYGYPEMVAALVEHAAAVNVVRNDGTTPKSIARHMYALAEAMPGTDDAGHDHARHGGEHDRHEHGHDPSHDGPHDHHRTRAEAVSSYARVLEILVEADASIEGVEDAASRESRTGFHHHH